MSNWIYEIEQKALSLGVNIDELCDAAAIARSTFTRLKNGKTKSGSVETYQKLTGALERLTDQGGE